ncbi:hypothetical protein [Richelia sinica]|uniref:hypothetical protein n=1 Tax=Richelia sinica TaxID=1357545 RepID=UPI001682C811|nr:hypothetical protein [Richelia sinica]MBD2664815.1 hypothetical protein [Richelia sinica FACHB-800]
MSLKINIYLLFAAIIFAIWPIPAVFIGVTVADWLGCDTSGLAVHCEGSYEISLILTWMTLSPTLLFYTVPIGGSIAAVLLIMLLIQLAIKRFKSQ